MIDGRLGQHVWTVHAARRGEAGAVEMIFAGLPRAVAYAAERSTDPTVISTSVTRYVLDEYGTATAITGYVDGRIHELPTGLDIRPGATIDTKDDHARFLRR